MTLGLRIRRSFFESLLEQATPSSFDGEMFEERADWKKSVEGSDVRLQWDPDHAPNGHALARRAIQLGLRGPTLQAFANRELLEVIDLTDFVESQRSLASADSLRTPVEHVYLPRSPIARKRTQLDG